MIRVILIDNVRYPPEHKAETREKIVKDASRRLRAEGLDGAAVSAVMRDTGLTHGGFYKHFPNKNELVTESLAQGFREMADHLIESAKKAPAGTAWKAIVSEYLSHDHCEHPDHGCPVAALAPELARADPDMQKQITAAMVDYKSRLAPFMPGNTPAARERAFFVIFSTMVGAVELARIIPNPSVRTEILSGAKDFLLKSFGRA